MKGRVFWLVFWGKEGTLANYLAIHLKTSTDEYYDHWMPADRYRTLGDLMHSQSPHWRGINLSYWGSKQTDLIQLKRDLINWLYIQSNYLSRQKLIIDLYIYPFKDIFSSRLTEMSEFWLIPVGVIGWGVDFFGVVAPKEESVVFTACPDWAGWGLQIALIWGSFSNWLKHFKLLIKH